MRSGNLQLPRLDLLQQLLLLLLWLLSLLLLLLHVVSIMRKECFCFLTSLVRMNAAAAAF